MIFADYIAETVAVRLTERMYFHILPFSATTLCENCHWLHCPFPLSDAKFPTPNDAKTPAKTMWNLYAFTMLRSKLQIHNPYTCPCTYLCTCTYSCTCLSQEPAHIVWTFGETTFWPWQLTILLKPVLTIANYIPKTGGWYRLLARTKSNFLFALYEAACRCLSRRTLSSQCPSCYTPLSKTDKRPLSKTGGWYLADRYRFSAPHAFNLSAET